MHQISIQEELYVYIVKLSVILDDIDQPTDDLHR